MRWHLPPPRAIIALESVVRTGSVTAAATELCVTHSAVSKQLSSLEEWFGRPLFEPGRRQMRPTPAARRLADAAALAWGILAAAADDVARQEQVRSLQVIAPATFAMRWLLPRLPLFQKARDDIKVSVRQTHTPEIWTDMPFDVAIRRGDSFLPHLRTTTFLRDELVLVASAESRWVEAQTLEDLPLLDADTRPGELTAWLKAALGRVEGAAQAVQNRPARFAHFYIALEATLHGQGVLVAPKIVVEELIGKRVLTVLFPEISVAGPSYWVGFDPRKPNAALADAFATWIIGHFRETARAETPDAPTHVAAAEPIAVSVRSLIRA